MKPRIGIAITTFNRRDMVSRQIDTIKQRTNCDFDLVVCDDGSSDGTVEALRERGEFVISGVNHGLAWNRNRGIFALMAILGCDIAILIHDDMNVIMEGWQTRWIDAASKVGIVNFGYPNMDEATQVIESTGRLPTLSRTLLGHCTAIHRFPWSMVGYLDTRFKTYGHESTEYTQRFLHIGFGGERQITEQGEKDSFYVMDGVNFWLKEKRDYTDSIAQNTAVWNQLQAEIPNTFRPPWSSPIERIEFLAEINLALQKNPVEIPYPNQGLMPA